MPKTTPESLKRLQNGSDVRGVALAGVENEPITITPESVFCLGCAFVDWLRETEKCTNNPMCTVGIGRDPRLSGPSLKDAFARGVQFKGGVAIDCELSTTPACFFATVSNRELGPAYEGCVMLTASHLPFNRNGIKFFTKDGGLDKKDVGFMCERAAEYIAEAEKEMAKGGEAKIESRPYIDKYSSILRDKIIKGINDGTNEPLKGFKIVVDAERERWVFRDESFRTVRGGLYRVSVFRSGRDVSEPRAEPGGERGDGIRDESGFGE